MKGKTICKTLGSYCSRPLILVVLYVTSMCSRATTASAIKVSGMRLQQQGRSPKTEVPVETGVCVSSASVEKPARTVPTTTCLWTAAGARPQQEVDRNARHCRVCQRPFARLCSLSGGRHRQLCCGIDETAYLSDAMTGCKFDEVFAQNYDSSLSFLPAHSTPRSESVWHDASRHSHQFRRARSCWWESGFMKP